MNWVIACTVVMTIAIMIIVWAVLDDLKFYAENRRLNAEQRERNEREEREEQQIKNESI